MKIPCSKALEQLAKNLGGKLYIVGGYVRNYLTDKSVSKDVDLASPIDCKIIEDCVVELGGKILAQYKRTGTVVFALQGIKYEFTTFRKDGYSAGGNHTPDKVDWTDDIREDALRRDFKCNAVYYDILNERIVDVLDGVEDIKNRILDTVKAPKEVFSHDGLRLMRLARFCAELGFSPTKEVIEGAKQNAKNIKDISVERVWTELKYILQSDQKYAFSDKQGHYTGLKILDKTRVLDEILPELTLGRNMAQRADFHKHDVLEHTLRCVLYSPKEARFFALMHDIGKPYSMINTGKFHAHEKSGVAVSKKVLERLKVDSKTKDQTIRLIATHMLDMDCNMKESKVRAFIVKNHDIFPLLTALKQADFRASGESTEKCLTVIKWQKIYQKMLADGTPFSIKDLKIDAKMLMELGYKGEEIGKELEKLFSLCITSPDKNTKQNLYKKAEKDAKKEKRV